MKIYPPGFPRRTLPLLALLSLAASAGVAFAVPLSDYTLQKPVTDNVCTIAPNIGFEYGSGTLPGPQIPIYAPYDTQYTQWWDNLVAELVQSRLTTLNLDNRGIDIYTPPPAVPTGGGNMDPRRLSKLIDAMNRAGVLSEFKFINGVDTAAPGVVQNIRRSKTGGYDMSITDDWDTIWWQMFIKPWCDTIPQANWYRIGGRPVIYIWSISTFVNKNPYASQMLEFLRQKFVTAYGEDPVFMLTGWFSEDPNVSNLSCVVAQNPWFSSTQGWNMTTFDGYTSGTFIAGYGSGNPIPVPRNGVTGTGVNGDTFQAGLTASFNNNVADLMLIEGFTNNTESMGLYRSKDAAWDYPNQYINMLPFYTDARTVTQRLEAEGCDSYSDTTTGNTGGKFRSDDLDVKELVSGGGWQVGWTAANEWIEFKNVPFSAGNYRFVIRYGSTASHTVRLLVDGVAQPDITLASTGSADTFNTGYLTASAKAMSHGTHTLRLLWVDGGVDVDWIFLKKTDPIVSLKSALTSKYLTALSGGNSSLQTDSTLAAAWQYFTVDDLTGTLTSGNNVSIQAANGLYLCAESGGGGAANINRRTPGAWETWKIVKVSGTGALVNGDQVALQCSNGNYLTAQSNGYIYANGTTIGTAQTFTLGVGSVDTAPPAAPSNLVATTASGSQINLTWTDNASNETAYYVERSFDRMNYSVIATLGPNTTSYSNTGLSGYTDVYYRVRASNSVANTDYSNLAKATTTAGISAVPANVVAYGQPSFTSAAARVMWSASNGATSYQVKRATASGGPYANVGSPTTAVSYPDTTAVAGTTYYYVVSAINSYGTSGNSASSSVTPAVLSQTEIGGTGGSGTYSGGVFSLTSVSGDIDNNNATDVCRYAYQTMTGDGSIIARVTAIGGTYAYTKSGLMVRDSLNNNALNVLMSMLYGSQTNFQYRPTTATTTYAYTRITGVSVPRWIRLDRIGNDFYGYYSDDGSTWYSAGYTTLALPATIDVGITQTQGVTGTFDNVLIRD